MSSTPFGAFLPDDPEVNQIWPDPNDPDYDDIHDGTGRTWKWDGEVWRLQTERVLVLDDNTIIGATGAPGPAIPGPIGSTGPIGPMGATGYEGSTGPIGRGLDGRMGATGPKGDAGIAVCEQVITVPSSGQRGRLFIDSINQIFVTVKGDT